ncbi:MAG: restriction endonuclease subunit S, partial [Candidatus Heimdallarchaeaceae archaeon]
MTTSRYKQTEIGLIPEEWKLERLSDNAVFKNGINFTRDDKGNTGILTIDVLNMYSNSIYINLNNLYRVNKEISESYHLKNGDILFVRSSLKREGVGWAALFKEIKEKVTYCGFIIRARLKTKKFDPKFLTYYLRTNIARKSLISRSGKVAITNINQGMLGNLLIPLPPLSEQQNIAYILSTVQEAIEKTDAVIRATKLLKRSLMEHLFTYGPVPITGREQVKLKETEIGLIPEEWEIIELDKVGKIITGTTPSTKKREY